MKRNILIRGLLFGLCLVVTAAAFTQSYKPAIEWKQFAWNDPRLIIKSGYLIVPENRMKPNGKTIQLPFIFIRRPDQHPTRNISLYMVGGPGYSTTFGIDSIGYEFGYIKFGGTIMLGQRGTKMAIPCLECAEVTTANNQRYKTSLNFDSLRLEAIKQCRERLTKQGIDLPAYTTMESASDINDLRKALELDSLNLIGLSYSGGLMLEVARNHPECVRTLVLRSPLPVSVHYDEHALFNFNEALETVFENCRTDSADRKYTGLKKRFQAYFTGITGREFSINYLENGKQDSIRVFYSKSDLLEVINDKLSEGDGAPVPAIMIDFIEGRHEKWITAYLNAYFNGKSSVAAGMRYTVFCADQTLMSSEDLQHQQNAVLPWLWGYRYNNVDRSVCACWKVKPASGGSKHPVFSSVPVLIGGGDLDPGCSLFYNRLIRRTLPNAQLLIQHNAGHGAGFKIDGVDYLEAFFADPYSKLVSKSKDVRIE
ncbi:alpha/beta fold hydrolase [Niabella sp.]|uniref:alpha/beta hydrolase n=1 Tax=Niabella sp. TaxID=1962976 RepID=UPI00260A9965|nr:alpha/beta fold hydrolase [Niabella sp.]